MAKMDLGVWRLAALAAALGTGLAVDAAEVSEEGLATDPPVPAGLQVAQFELSLGTREGTRPEEREALLTQQFLKEMRYAYAYGSDTELTYLVNPDLNKQVRDDFMLFAPTFFGWVDYRPTTWLDSRLEMTLEWPVAFKEEKQLTLPNGDVVFRQKRKVSLLVDQAYVTVKNITAPFEITAGRRNFEDPRLWLYDAALDAFIVKYKQDNFYAEASMSRENIWDLDLLTTTQKDRIDNYILYMEYRGIEDHKLAGYTIKRYDQAAIDGRPLLMGVRAHGRPTDAYNYWADLAFVRGHDELSQKLSGRGYDVGVTYRFLDRPLQPSITLGYAYGTGDADDTDNKNTQFRQTGLQSNEARFGGLTQFKAYGEMLDPDLSNIKIVTAGIGFRMASNAFLDLVYHRYGLDHFANEFRSAGVTAEMNKVETQLSKDVGSEINLIVGFRNLFGFRRFGFEVRAGVFSPGDAFLRNDGDAVNPIIVRADKASSILFVLIL